MTTIHLDIGDVFLIDPRHEDFVREDSPHLKDRSLTWTQRIMVLLVIAAAAYLVLSQITEANRRTEAEVVSLREGAELINFFVTYTFTVESEASTRTYEVEEAVDLGTFQRLAPGDMIEIRYDPRDPFIAEIVEGTQDEINATSLLFTVICGLVLLVGFMLVFWIIQPDRTNRRLENEGQLLIGRLHNAWPTQTQRRYTVNVEFTFTPPGAEPITTKASRRRRDLEKELLPSAGTTVLVLYVNDNLYRLM